MKWEPPAIAYPYRVLLGTCTPSEEITFTNITSMLLIVTHVTWLATSGTPGDSSTLNVQASGVAAITTPAVAPFVATASFEVLIPLYPEDVIGVQAGVSTSVGFSIGGYWLTGYNGIA